MLPDNLASYSQIPQHKITRATVSQSSLCWLFTLWLALFLGRTPWALEGCSYKVQALCLYPLLVTCALETDKANVFLLNSLHLLQCLPKFSLFWWMNVRLPESQMVHRLSGIWDTSVLSGVSDTSQVGLQNQQSDA